MLNYYLFFLLTVFVFPIQIYAQISVKIIPFNGWEEAVEIKTDIARVVVVPSVGRIIHYGFIDSANVFLVNSDYDGVILPKNGPLKNLNGEMEWATFGGDRVWPTPEDIFERLNGHFRPPDHWIDGGAYEYEILHNGVKIISEISDYCGAQLRREITMKEESSKVFISQSLNKLKLAQNKALEPVPLTIWNMSRLPNPKETILQLMDSSRFDKSFKPFFWDGVNNDPLGHFIKNKSFGIFLPDTMCQKVGADSHHWVAGVVGNTVIGEFFNYYKEAEYPDGGTSASICYCPGFVEIECLSPIKYLRIGESMEFNIYWDLLLLPDIAVEEQRLIAVDWLNEQ